MWGSRNSGYLAFAQTAQPGTLGLVILPKVLDPAKVNIAAAWRVCFTVDMGIELPIRFG